LFFALFTTTLSPTKTKHYHHQPSNVLLKSNIADARRFTCKVSDFGLARLAAAATHVSTLATGTAAYQAPEALSRGRLSRPGDVFSFGILMAELWTRNRPFAGLAIGQVVYGVVYAGARPDLPPDCPAGYASLARACWADDPDSRPTFTQITATLRGLLQEAVAAARAEAGVDDGGEGGGGGGRGGGRGGGGRGGGSGSAGGRG
jgi:serine/threonine protein kinase